MHKQTMQFAVKKENGVIKEVGKTAIFIPKTNFKGDSNSIKWYEDKMKQKNN